MDFKTEVLHAAAAALAFAGASAIMDGRLMEPRAAMATEPAECGNCSTECSGDCNCVVDPMGTICIPHQACW